MQCPSSSRYSVYTLYPSILFKSGVAANIFVLRVAKMFCRINSFNFVLRNPAEKCFVYHCTHIKINIILSFIRSPVYNLTFWVAHS